MVFKLPSARCLSKSRREGHLSENMANPAMRTSVKGIAVSSLRSSGTLAKRLRTKPKSASAERCLRSLGAMKPISTPKMTTSKREIVSVRGGLSHGGLRKSSCDIGVFTGVRCLPGIAVVALSIEKAGGFDRQFFRGNDRSGVTDILGQQRRAALDMLGPRLRLTASKKILGLYLCVNTLLWDRAAGQLTDDA